MTNPEITSLQSLEQIVLGADFVVPPYPAVALKLRRLLESEKFGLTEVANTAAADPALAATLLKLANSAAHGNAGPAITTLGRAVHRLGARSVAALAAAIQIGTGACAEGPLVDLKYRVWRRTVSTALACQKLAVPRSLDADAAFLAGLLRGFGCSVALGCLERMLARMSRMEARTPAEWLAAIEPHQSTLARRVAEHWQLPREIVDAVAPPPGSTKSPIASLIGVAERLIAEIERGSSAEEVAGAPELSAKERRAALELMEELAPALEALVLAPEVIKPRQATSAVRRPTSSLRANTRPTQLDVRDLKNRRAPLPLKGIAVAPDGIVFTSERPMQEGCVARLGLNVPPASIEGWFSVASCQSEQGGYRIEAQAFAATAELREALTSLWTAAAP